MKSYTTCKLGGPRYNQLVSAGWKMKGGIRQMLQVGLFVEMEGHSKRVHHNQYGRYLRERNES